MKDALIIKKQYSESILQKMTWKNADYPDSRRKYSPKNECFNNKKSATELFWHNIRIIFFAEAAVILMTLVLSEENNYEFSLNHKRPQCLRVSKR